MKDEQKPVWMVRPKDDPPYVICSCWEDVRQMIEADEMGAEWLVKQVLLTQEQIEAALEFDGW